MLVEVSVCGICRTDLHVIEGELERRQTPLIPAIRSSAPSAVWAWGDDRRDGERVGIAWLQGTCGQCNFARAGGRICVCRPASPAIRSTAVTPNMRWCRRGLPIRFLRHFTDDEAAPLLCAGIIGYRALRFSGFKPGQRLGIYGFGASAHIAIQIARHWGCRSVRVFAEGGTSGTWRASWAPRGRASRGSPAGSAAWVDYLCAGRRTGAVPALRALERGGTLALAGIHMSTIPPMDYDRDLFGERTSASVTANTRQDGMDLLPGSGRDSDQAPHRPLSVGAGQSGAASVEGRIVSTGRGVLPSIKSREHLA